MAEPPSYTSATGYPQQPGGYPPPQGQYPPPQGQYPPPQGQYPPPQGQYPPPQEKGQFPPAQQPGYGSGYNQPYQAPEQYPPVGSGYEYRAATSSPLYEPGSTGFAGTQQPADTEAKWEGVDSSAFAGGNFSEKAIRHAFIKKVYLILTAQLSVTVAAIAFFQFHLPTKYWVRQNAWFYYCSYATFLVTYITLVCCPSVRRKHPGNYICLTVFTLAFSYMTATIASFYDTEIVLIAAGITAAVCFSISLFAIQTKIDFTMCTGLIFALCMVVFMFGISCMIVYMTLGYSHILNCVYGALAGLLFCLFLAYDTQMLIGGKKHSLSEEEYIFGALQLYLDVVYIFLIILSFFGGKSN